MSSKPMIIRIPSLHIKELYCKPKVPFPRNSNNVLNTHQLCLSNADNPSSMRGPTRTGTSTSLTHPKTRSILKKDSGRKEHKEDNKIVKFSEKNEYLRIVSKKSNTKEIPFNKAKEDKIERMLNRRCVCIIF